jgi:glycosyltransferase involved in cell wall biosynthesis
MRVALITQSSAWSGTEVHTLELAAVMAERGHAVTIVQGGREVYAHKVADRSIPVRVTSLPLRYAGLSGLGADLGVLIRGNCESGSALGDAVHRFAFSRFVTIEHMAQNPSPPRPKVDVARLPPRLGLWWYREAVRKRARSLWPHLTVCVAESVRAGLVADCGIPPSRIATVQNGVDTSRFRRDEAGRRELHARWGIDSAAFVFGAVARLSPMKNLALAIQGVGELRALGHRNIWLVLVGEGSERPALERAARECGVAGRVLFPGATDNPAAAYSALDAFVMPSLSEGLPFALLEAMSSECVSIATNVGGIPEVIAGPHVGSMVGRGDAAGFIAAMRSATAMPIAQRRTIGAAARRHVHTHFNAAVQYAALAEILERSAGRAGEPRNGVVQ